MRNFTISTEGKEVAEISVDDKHITVRSKNFLRNLSIFPSLVPFVGILGALKDSGYRVTFEAGPLELSFGDGR